MSWTLWGLAVQTIAGFFGAHAAAGAAHEYRFGLVGHSIAGLVGGALSGTFLPRGSRHDRGGQRQPELVDGRGIRGDQALSGAVAGGILMMAVGFLEGGGPATP